MNWTLCKTALPQFGEHVLVEHIPSKKRNQTMKVFVAFRKEYKCGLVEYWRWRTVPSSLSYKPTDIARWKRIE